MGQLDYASPEGNVIEKPARSKPGKKRKWREIEALKERQRLLRELKDIDFCSSTDDVLIDTDY